MFNNHLFFSFFESRRTVALMKILKHLCLLNNAHPSFDMPQPKT